MPPYADIPNKRCVRVREGGDILPTVGVDCGCLACMLGRQDGRTLFIVATEWRGSGRVDSFPSTLPRAV